MNLPSIISDGNKAHCQARLHRETKTSGGICVGSAELMERKHFFFFLAHHGLASTTIQKQPPVINTFRDRFPSSSDFSVEMSTLSFSLLMNCVSNY